MRPTRNSSVVNHTLETNGQTHHGPATSDEIPLSQAASVGKTGGQSSAANTYQAAAGVLRLDSLADAGARGYNHRTVHSPQLKDNR